MNGMGGGFTKKPMSCDLEYVLMDVTEVYWDIKYGMIFFLYGFYWGKLSFIILLIKIF